MKKRSGSKSCSKSVVDAQLSKVYYDPKQQGSFGGVDKLHKRFPKKSKKHIKDWLASQLTYTLHKPIKRKFPTVKYKTSGPNDLWQMDLMEMIPYAVKNKGNKYILTCIDVYSRFARALPVKKKDGESLVEAISKMLKSTVPRHIQTDLGKEFYNKKVRELFEKNKINHYSVESQFKAALVERFNRTLRERLNRIFTYRGNKKWVNVLPDIIKTYNHSSHRGIGGMKPVDLLDNDLNEWLEVNKDVKKKKKKNIKLIPIGRYVRISKITSDPFRNKNFNQNWTEEIFQVAKHDIKNYPPRYELRDLSGEMIKFKFYHEELQDIGTELPKVFRIEKILDVKGTGKNVQYLVKWHGYKDKTSWISKAKFVKHL